MTTGKVYPEPDFEKQRDPEADEAHHALLDACIRHHRKRPHIWQIACKAADKKLAEGRKHTTGQMIAETAREIAEDTRTSEEREHEFKLANAHIAFVTRAMVDLGIVPPDFFDFNEQPSKKRKAPKAPQTPASVNPDPARPRDKGRKT